MSHTPELPENDVKIIEAELNEITEKPEGTTVDQITEFIRDRIYTEWCRGDGLRMRRGATRMTHGEYNGEGYTNWIDLETHLLIEKEHSDPPTHDEYLQARARIVRAATRRAVMLYIEWKGEDHPIDWGEHDTRNLREDHMYRVA
jgi:hypothetical protein